jgi:hypothetical protein
VIQRKRFLSLALLILLMAAISPLSSATPSWAEAIGSAALQAAIAGRSVRRQIRLANKYRHPLETLSFKSPRECSSGATFACTRHGLAVAGLLLQGDDRG